MKKFEVYTFIVNNVVAETKEDAKWAIESGEHNSDVARCYVGRVDEVEEFRHD